MFSFVIFNNVVLIKVLLENIHVLVLDLFILPVLSICVVDDAIVIKYSLKYRV